MRTYVEQTNMLQIFEKICEGRQGTYACLWYCTLRQMLKCWGSACLCRFQSCQKYWVCYKSGHHAHVKRTFLQVLLLLLLLLQREHLRSWFCLLSRKHFLRLPTCWSKVVEMDGIAIGIGQTNACKLACTLAFVLLLK